MNTLILTDDEVDVLLNELRSTLDDVTQGWDGFKHLETFSQLRQIYLKVDWLKNEIDIRIQSKHE